MVKLKHAIIGICFALLSGCSLLSHIVPTPGINTNAQVGKENVQQIVGNQDRTDIQARDGSVVTSTKADSGIAANKIATAKSNKAIKTVGSTVDASKINEVKQTTAEDATDIRADKVNTINVNKSIPIWMILFALLGWILPTPAAMWEALKTKFKRK
jgi:hypothetical protein